MRNDEPPRAGRGGEVLGLAYSVRAFRVGAAGSPVRATALLNDLYAQTQGAEPGQR
jgi:hypothetical protein